MRVRWLPEAWQDTQRRYDFLFKQDPVAAGRVMETLLEGSDRLVDMPDIGRPMDDDTGRRECFLPFGTGTYVLRYMIDNEKNVVIIRVWHRREHR
ncbi:MAG: type II toxin-antitoxin system RelE/ParE family toxin [Ectothiorhodospiraceae bacterium]|nr:type II toxin-antitoxin system RelE/ParE family toxin [Ectothiorhodospiraceae bacterium]